MAYLGTTAASSVQNPPVLLVGNRAADGRIPGSGTTGSTIYVTNAYNQSSTAVYQEGRAFGGQLWGYWSTDNTTAVAGTGYFSDAGQLGMRPGDVVMCVGSTGGTWITRFLTVQNITTGGAAVTSTAPIAGTT